MTKRKIILVAFGTTDVEGLNGILNIYKKSKQIYDTEIVFTAGFIIKRWHRMFDSEEGIKLLNGGIVPEEIFKVKGLIHKIGECFDEGFYDIAIQPLHIFHGEEYEGIKSTLEQLSAIKDKNSHRRKIVLGRPLLGTNSSKKPYKEDIIEVVKGLWSDVKMAKDLDACLVYIGHGNENYSTGAYLETEYYFRKEYGSMVFLANVEGFPFIEDLPERVKKGGFSKAVLKPFMLVAGDHAKNDIFGEVDSVQTILESNMIEVIPVCSGLGEMDCTAEIFLNRIKELIYEK